MSDIFCHPVSLKTVIEQEREYIKQRRYYALKPFAPPETDLGSENTVGLALSGGGMRSAMFNLGVVQALAKYGFLPWVDYMTTVSGGGYFGSCMTSLLSTRILTLPGNTKFYSDPCQNETFTILSPSKPNQEVEIVGKEWWLIRITHNGQGIEGWINAYPDQINSTETGVCCDLYVWDAPTTQSNIITLVAAGTQVDVVEMWYRIRCWPPGQAADRFIEGWVKTPDAQTETQQKTGGQSPAFKFKTQFNKFPFNPHLDVFQPTKNNAEPANTTQNKRQAAANPHPVDAVPAADYPKRNHQLYHMRLKGNFVIPRRGWASRDMLRAIGTVLTGVSHMVWIFLLLILVTAAAHYVLAGFLTSRSLNATAAPTVPLAAAEQTGGPGFAEQRFVVYQRPKKTDTANELLLTTARAALTQTNKLPVLVDWLPAILFSEVSLPELAEQSESWKPPFKIPSEYLVFAFVGAIVAIISARQLYKYTKNETNLPGTRPGLSSQEVIDKKMLWQYVVMIGLFALVILAAGLKLRPDAARTTRLYWLWVPTAFMVGNWLTTTLAYPIFFRNKYWTQRFRTIIAAWQGLNTYVLLFTIVFAVLALPYYIGIGNAADITGSGEGNLVLWAIAALVSFLSSSILVKGGGVNNGLFKKLSGSLPGLQKVLLNVLVVILLAALIAFFGTLFNRIPTTAIAEAKIYAYASGSAFVAALLVGVAAVFWRFIIRRRQLGSWWLQAILVLLIFSLLLGMLWFFQGGIFLWGTGYWLKLLAVLAIGILALVTFLLLGAYVNLNRISLHYFYRDRLADAFLKTEILSRQGQVKTVRDQNALKLQDINPEACSAPYHLISATLNLPGSKILTYKDRKAEHFIFSRLFCGADSTGYVRTTLYRGGFTKLARAMAISGAAVSSTLGHLTFFGQAFMMTILNLRLGYWMDNPSKYSAENVTAPGLWKKLIKRSSDTTFTNEAATFWPAYLLYEMFGRADNNKKLVNLSDGGHLDNLGLYPLLQRKCRLIIVGDAGADPNYTCNEVARIIRHAYIENNITININLDLLRPNADTGFSAQHSAVGEIIYPDGTTGWLIYLKPAVTSDEDADIIAYWLNHQDDHYPQQTTADQFYDEAQFEAYRRLGELTVEHTLFALKDYYEEIKATHIEKMASISPQTYTELRNFIKHPRVKTEKVRDLYRAFMGVAGDFDFWDEQEAFRGMSTDRPGPSRLLRDALRKEVAKFFQTLEKASIMIDVFEKALERTEPTITLQQILDRFDALANFTTSGSQPQSDDTSAAAQPSTFDRMVNCVAAHIIPDLQQVTGVGFGEAEK